MLPKQRLVEKPEENADGTRSDYRKMDPSMRLTCSLWAPVTSVIKDSLFKGKEVEVITREKECTFAKNIQGTHTE